MSFNLTFSTHTLEMKLRCQVCFIVLIEKFLLFYLTREYQIALKFQYRKHNITEIDFVIHNYN